MSACDTFVPDCGDLDLAMKLDVTLFMTNAFSFDGNSIYRACLKTNALPAAVKAVMLDSEPTGRILQNPNTMPGLVVRLSRNSFREPTS